MVTGESDRILNLVSCVVLTEIDMALLLGIDVGSSSVKVSLMDIDSGACVADTNYPKTEAPIAAPQPGFAEQNPGDWWDYIKKGIAEIKASSSCDPSEIKAIGISYQMHGLVCVDKAQKVLRPSIIWCDSRAVSIGEAAAREIGEKKCLESLLNLPGNFTASKLKWVMENEPDIYARIDKIMLPGDYVAMKMTGRATTTGSGLSEGIMWDYKKETTASFLLDHYGIDRKLISDIVPTFGIQGELTTTAANELGLAAGTPVAYRGGDQPNNALSLNVLKPGEVAVTAGTSGVVYGITDKTNNDPKSRVNIFVHVNHKPKSPRYGVLLCLNGTGILNSWLKHNVAVDIDYKAMDRLAGEISAGSDGLMLLPYGNGAERTLENRNPGASFHNLDFNRHSRAHMFRAAQEGIVFALNYGMGVMRDIGMSIGTVRAGHANMFFSPVFQKAFATVSGATVELYNTDGALGAARGAGMGAGIYKSASEAFASLKPIKAIEPDSSLTEVYKDTYGQWTNILEKALRS